MRLDPLAFSFDMDDPKEQLSVVHDPIRYELAKKWIEAIPRGFKTDFASIPGAVWPMFRFLRVLHRINSAALVHDWLYATHTCSRTVADAVFYQELRESGVSRWVAKILHWSVHIFGKAAYASGPDRLKQDCPELAARIAKAPHFEGIQ